LIAPIAPGSEYPTAATARQGARSENAPHSDTVADADDLIAA
jgi:hypothetical protein